MEEKIKIHLTKFVYDLLLRDCEAFEFFKKDNLSLNKNAFLTALINNYYKSYQLKEKELSTIIKNTLIENNSKLDNDYVSNVLVSKINKLTSSPNKEKYSSIITLKPTKESFVAISYIEKYLLQGSAISEYFRNMFTSYASLPQDQRERVIFKEQYDLINQAIKEKKKLFFASANRPDLTYEASPYCLTTSNEEMHYYLLCTVNKTCRTYRMSRIRALSILNETAIFKEDEITLFNKMIKYGPQFTYRRHDEPVVVQLTDQGKKFYKLFYVHRPKYESINGDLYTFNCSHNQISIYFRRFGKEAFIVSPKYLQEEMITFYNIGRKSYIRKLNIKI